MLGLTPSECYKPLEACPLNNFAPLLLYVSLLFEPWRNFLTMMCCWYIFVSLVPWSCHVFHTITQDAYESSDFTCDCDSVELFAYCSSALDEIYYVLILAYDETIQDYNGGVACKCPTPTCDTSPTDCVTVNVQENTCGVSDIAADSDLCADCRICSTATGLIEYEADACYATASGCMKTLLIASFSGATSTETQSPTITSPSSSPASGQQSPPNNGFVGSGGTLAYVHTGVLAVVITIFFTLSL
jgi:hypothetical protein